MADMLFDLNLILQNILASQQVQVVLRYPLSRLSIQRFLQDDSFSGTYYSERDGLSLIYKVDDIPYRFIYTFGANTHYEYDSEPVLQDVKAGSFELDLYQRDGRLVGFVIETNMLI